MLYCIPLQFIFSAVVLYSIVMYFSVHLMIAQSTTYFKIRLNRVEKNLKQIADQSSQEFWNPVRRQSVGKKRDKKTTRRPIIIDDVVLDLQETLDELDQHNLLIKHFLRDELYGLGGIFVAFLVFVLAKIPWYYKILVSGSLIIGVTINVVSFTNASQLYIRILKMAKALHSCQCVSAQNQRLELRPRSAPSTSQGIRPSMISDLLILKSKFQILRMIQRVSSPHLRIGYTVGNGESFSDDTAAAYVSSIFGNTLMFLNAIN